jgi:SAM-dependent methyltransferase
MESWHENDEFWQQMAHKIFTLRHWEGAPSAVEHMVSLMGLQPGATILDLCCGPGRHTLELARRGFGVTGVDRTSLYLDQARAQAEKEGLEVELVQADMRTFRRPEAFDGAINMYTSFGYFEDPSEERQVLLNLYASLKPGGALLMDMSGKEVVASMWREREWNEIEGVIYLEERKVRPGWDWMDNRWTMLKGSERKDFTLSIRLYSAAELTSLLKEAGFSSIQVFGDLEGGPYDHTAKRLVALARKQG